MDGGIGEDLVEDIIAVDAAVHDEGEDALGTPLEAGSKACDEGEEAAAQVVEVIGAFEVDGVALGGVDVVAVDEFVSPSDVVNARHHASHHRPHCQPGWKGHSSVRRPHSRINNRRQCRSFGGFSLAHLFGFIEVV